MNALQKGLLLGTVQLAIVASLGAKLEWDRARLPRAWAKAVMYDPSLPIRGRYLALRLQVQIANPDSAAAEMVHERSGTKASYWTYQFWGTLVAKDGQLMATVWSAPELESGAPPVPRESMPLMIWHPINQEDETVLQEPVLFFLAEHADNPWQEAKNGELWAEVTVPKDGPPRPIRLALKRGEQFTPLETK